MKLTRLVVVLMLASLAGCATNAPQFCDSETWQERGYVQAMKGQNDQSDETPNNCAAKDAPLAYRIGFDYGLKKYCTFKRGMWAGEHGQGPAESCAEPQWDEYQTGYVTGHSIFNVNVKLEAISKKLESARTELWALEAAGRHATSSSVKAKQTKIEQLKRDREQASRHLTNLRADTHRH